MSNTDPEPGPQVWEGYSGLVAAPGVIPTRGHSLRLSGTLGTKPPPPCPARLRRAVVREGRVQGRLVREGGSLTCRGRRTAPCSSSFPASR